jgi:hypothetical protein
VIAFNTAEGWSRDVTGEIAREILETAMARGETLTRSARAFVEHATDEQIPLAVVEGH